MMTEQEAQEKWCPMARLAIGPDGVYQENRRENTDKCLGSACACWVWVVKDQARFGGTPLPMPEETWRGRCGLTK